MELAIRYTCSRCGSILYENIIVDGTPANIIYCPEPRIYLFTGLFSPSEVRDILNGRCPFCGKVLGNDSAKPRITYDNTVSKEVVEMIRKLVKNFGHFYSYIVHEVVKVLKENSVIEFSELVEKIYGSHVTHNKKQHLKKIIERLQEQGLVEVVEKDNTVYVKIK